MKKKTKKKDVAPQRSDAAGRREALETVINFVNERDVYAPAIIAIGLGDNVSSAPLGMLYNAPGVYEIKRTGQVGREQKAIDYARRHNQSLLFPFSRSNLAFQTNETFGMANQ